MAIILNQTDCSTAIKGTGTLGCKVAINLINQFFLLEKGTELDTVTDTLDQAKIDELVQNGQMVILPEHFSFTSEGGDTVYEELPSGGKIPVRNGLYEFLPLYSGSSCLSNALSSLHGKTWTVIAADDDDSGESRWWGEETSDGKFKGFDTNLVYAENMVLNDGSVSTKTPLRIQLSTKGTQAMRSRKGYLSSNDTVDLSSLDGVNDIALNAVTTTAVGFEVEAVTDCDGSTKITSVTDLANWRIVDTATSLAVTPTSVSVVGGNYVFVDVPAGSYTVTFYDSTANTDIIAVNGVYYDSNTLSVTLTA